MADTFALDVSKWVAKAKGREALVKRKIALDLFSRIILRSPVDTGRFRGNWHVSLGAPVDVVSETTDKDGGATISAAASVIANAQASETIFLINNLPYGPALERGHSKQAPQGMVGLTIAEFQAAAASAVAGAKREIP